MFRVLTSQIIMPKPPIMNRNFRPVQSMRKEDNNVATKFIALFNTEPRIAFWLLNPTVRNNNGEKMAMATMPVNS